MWYVGSVTLTERISKQTSTPYPDNTTVTTTKRVEHRDHRGR